MTNDNPGIWMKRRKYTVWFDWYYVAQDTRCNALNGGRNLVLPLDLCNILEKVAPETRKQAKNQKKTSEKIVSYLRKKIKEIVNFHTLLSLGFLSEINVEAVKWNLVVCGVLNCWPPVAKDATNAGEPTDTEQGVKYLTYNQHLCCMVESTFCSSLVLLYCTVMSRWRKLSEQLCSSRWSNYFGKTSKAVKT